MSQKRFLTNAQITELGNFAYMADKEARSDLALGYITGENDYTSNFTGALRRILNSNSLTGLSAVSYVLPNRIEQRLGCDATIIVQNNGTTKISVFEAKLPRFATGSRNWDSIQATKNKSHFVSQLERQSQYVNQLAIFEMFYCEFPFVAQPNFMHAEVSSCCLHFDASKFNSGRANPDSVWNNGDLASLLTSHNITIKDVMTKLGNCEIGERISWTDSIESLAREFQLPGPILTIKATDAGYE